MQIRVAGKHIVLLIVIDIEEHLKITEMKKENKPTKKESDQRKEEHVNQNVYDFNPSQFTTEEELEKIKWRKEKSKKEEKDKLEEKDN